MASSIMVAVRVRPDSKAEQHQDGGADFLRVADDRTVSPTRAKWPYFEISSVALSLFHISTIASTPAWVLYVVGVGRLIVATRFDGGLAGLHACMSECMSAECS
jgi:hypothetical protein